MAEAESPCTPPKKGSKANRVWVEISGLWNSWEEDPIIRKAARKRKSLLCWPDPSKTGFINKASLKANWRVILNLVRLYCPLAPSNKTAPVGAIKKEVAKFFEEISLTPRVGLVHCESHSLRMFLSYINRRNDGSKKKDSCIAQIFEEVQKHWAPKIRSRGALVEADDEVEGDEQDDDGCEQDQLTEPDEDEDSQDLVDPYLASAMGLEAGSPQPCSAYVGTIPYEVNDENGKPAPSEPSTALANIDDACDADLVRSLAEIEHLAGSRFNRLRGYSR
ncbi:unnamed protein product [Symbiodinium sp. CCMP2456]|nr:unnamed protein product [Symbiodinium sp. CCMP2456]